MHFGWDDAKSERTKSERGFGFADILEIFASGRLLEREDTRWDYGELRMVAVGMVGGGLVTVVYTDRDQLRWIISARVASRKERRIWHERFG